MKVEQVTVACSIGGAVALLLAKGVKDAPFLVIVVCIFKVKVFPQMT